MIGIRLADHSVFPVFSSDELGAKRLVLTTARDAQERVDIELIRTDDSHADRSRPLSIGRITLEDLQSGRGGDPEIDLVLHVTPGGRLEATATNRATGNAKSISIDIDRATTEAEFSVPESLTESFEPNLAVEVQGEPRSRRSGWLLVLAIILVIVVLAGGMWWMLLRAPAPGDGARGDGAEEVPTTQSPDEAIELPQEPEREDPPDPSPRQEEPLVTDSPPPPGVDGDSVEYRIRRGDTLWDLSETFYGTPWLFLELADANEIRNPNLIYAESELEIPEELLRRENE